MDTLVADVFGYHALQLGLPAVRTLTANRMPHRWVAQAHPFDLNVDPGPEAEAADPTVAECLRCMPESLPFPDQSLDLVTLPHTLELSQDPHRTLAEVARVLRPEGRVVISGINPSSLWVGIHFTKTRLGGKAGESTAILPGTHELIGPGRLRDWLKLLNFDVETILRGCYRPPLKSERWLERLTWMEDAGNQWWPLLGATYALIAVKRVHGMRLIGLTRPGRLPSVGARITAAQRRR